jgi:PleD family two-component response regulator
MSMSESPLDRLSKRLSRRLEAIESRAQHQDVVVFVVDDEPFNVDSLVRALRDRYQVRPFVRAEDALDALMKGEHPELIITDQRMPGMSGVELLEQVRALLPSCMGIILSGYTEKNDLIGGINRGHVYQYLTKPWNLDVLLAAVGRTLEHARALAERDRLSAEMESCKHGMEPGNVDAVLGLFDERHFRATLVNELRRHARHGTPLSLLLLQAPGGPTAPLAKAGAAAVVAQLRETPLDLDLAALLGSGELWVLLPHLSPAAAKERALRMIQRLSEARSTLRIGLSGLPEGAGPPGEPLSADELMARARRALEGPGEDPVRLG